MSPTPPRTTAHWSKGAAAVCQAVDAWLAQARSATLLRDNPRRRLARLDDPVAGALLIKQFRVGSGRHVLRERAKAWLGAAPARREWRALHALRARNVAVPEPLALGTLPNGDRLLVLRFVEGRPLDEALRDAPQARRPLLAALGRAVRALHEAGWRHGDLHHGNVLVRADGAPVLLDLQHARRGAGAAARARDLGFLDHALAPLVSSSDRLRVQRGALGADAPRARADRAALRAIAREARARAFAHARSRTRRCLREGRAYARWRGMGASGLRVRDVEEDALATVLAAHARARPGRAGDGAERLKDDGRSRVTRVQVAGLACVVKEIRARGVLRPLADLVRGSAARRAWLGGHGLLARGVGAARPLAFLERRVLGLPLSSTLVLADLAPATPADAALSAPESERDAIVDALATLAIALHRRGADHGDLKASHVFVRRTANGIETALIDLEGVRFARGGIAERERVRALAQLNASLGDAFSAEARCRAFARYACALPFRAAHDAARDEVVRASLARRHRWSGAGCEAASRARDGGG